MSRLQEILSVLTRNRAYKEMTPQKLCRILEELGPTYVKLGQIMATGSSVLPPAYCEALSTLRTDVLPMPFDEVRAIVEREFGCALSVMFADFDAEVLGSASIAQVHHATLKSGQEVAVKVQRPGLREEIWEDIRLLRRMSRLLAVTPAKGVVDPDAIIDDLWKATESELDFLREADQLEHFRMANAGHADASCPRVYRLWTTRHVLTMEYIDGIRLDDRQTLLRSGHDLHRLLNRLCISYADQVLTARYFHADPHPGNILIRGDEIVWIDLGLVGELSMEDSLNLKKGIAAFVRMDAAAIAEVLIDMGSGEEPPDRNALIADIEAALRLFRETPMNELSVREFLNLFLNAAKKNHITMPTGVTMLTRGVVVLKSIADTLEPDADLLTLLVPIASKLKLTEDETE